MTEAGKRYGPNGRFSHKQMLAHMTLIAFGSEPLRVSLFEEQRIGDVDFVQGCYRDFENRHSGMTERLARTDKVAVQLLADCIEQRLTTTTEEGE